MEEHLSLLKSTFCQIVDIKENNLSILHNLETRIKKIKDMYSEFINSNRENLFVFTLDSFHYQSKLIDLEYEDMNRMFLSITNRMYCDYYKLFKIVVEYVNENIPDKKLTEMIKVHDNFPIYKDLEPFKQYDFQYVQGLHEIILVILTYIHTFIVNKEHDLKVYQTKNQIGLNIDSFVSTFSFNTIVMNQKAMLFINYMEFFHKSHTKYLKRFATKVNLMLSQINNDIKMDTAHDTQSTTKDTVNELKLHNLDKKLLNELKLSMNDDASIETKTPTSRSKSHSDSGVSDSGRSDDIVIEINQNELVSELTDCPEVKPKPRYSNAILFPENSSTISFESLVNESIVEETGEMKEEIVVEPMIDIPQSNESNDIGLLEPPEENIENIFT